VSCEQAVLGRGCFRPRGRYGCKLLRPSTPRKEHPLLGGQKDAKALVAADDVPIEAMLKCDDLRVVDWPGSPAACTVVKSGDAEGPGATQHHLRRGAAKSRGGSGHLSPALVF
jgi:Flp pilus assembly protein CpaB